MKLLMKMNRFANRVLLAIVMIVVAALFLTNMFTYLVAS